MKRLLRRGVLGRSLSLAMIVFAVTATSTGVHAATTEPLVSEVLVNELLRQAPGLNAEPLRLALRAADKAGREGLVPRRELLTVIDYSLPSTKPRLFVFNVAQRKLLFRELVAHGKNSGENMTMRFSNQPNSLATSLGLFVTGGTYHGGNGYSMRLRGLDRGFNDHAFSRYIVMHGASYVSEATARALGRIGRSWGCPAVPAGVAKKIIDTVKDGSPIFAYYPDANWLQRSRFING
ncbi:MAG TPA: murein L,D-transpeptidase catalytic domain family protein [Thermoanaerobaculia bacterium]|nr:murein L,D-transpeptidase catalytic domain family protein [Thermoanaerobaculia bacterium]